jgi:ribosomal-protein-alanine N-acetyltransferase
MEIRRLGPGTELPGWIEALERGTFGDTWGALDEGELILALDPSAFIRWRCIPAAGEAELLRLAVAAEARRQGLARHLLEASERLLKEQGIAELHLEVRTANAPARGLYETAGWKPVGIRKAYYRDGEDAALYRKEI